MTDITHDEEIRDYLVGRLSERERLVFQDRVARDPTLARELELSLRLRGGLRQLEREGYFAAPEAERHGARTLRLQRWLPLAAAAVVAAVSIGAWWQLRTPASILTATPTALVDHAEPRVWTFAATRGDENPRLGLPPRGDVELVVSPGLLDAKIYRVTLILGPQGAERTLGTLETERSASDGNLRAHVDAARLVPGHYRLRIDAEGGVSDQPIEFQFNLAGAGGSSAP